MPKECRLDTSLNDWMHAQRVHRDLDGPKVPVNPLGREASSRDTAQPETALPPKLAKAHQANQQRFARQRLISLYTALGRSHDLHRLLARAS